MFEGVLKFVNLKKMGIKNTIGFDVTENEGIRIKIAEEINKCIKNGGWCKIKIEPVYQGRTIQQGRKLNALIKEIANATGNDFKTVKNECKRIACEWYDYPVDEVKQDNIYIITPFGEERLNRVEIGYLIEAAEYIKSNYVQGDNNNG